MVLTRQSCAATDQVTYSSFRIRHSPLDSVPFLRAPGNRVRQKAQSLRAEPRPVRCYAQTTSKSVILMKATLHEKRHAYSTNWPAWAADPSANILRDRKARKRSVSDFTMLVQHLICELHHEVHPHPPHMTAASTTSRPMRRHLISVDRQKSSTLQHRIHCPHTRLNRRPRPRGDSYHLRTRHSWRAL